MSQPSRSGFRSAFLKQAAVFLGVLSLLASTVVFNRAVAQDKSGTPSQGTQVIPLRLANGHLMVLGFLFSNDGINMNSVSLELALDSPEVMTLHGDQHGWLQMDAKKLEKGESVFVDLLLKPDMELHIPGREIKVEQSRERMMAHGELIRTYSNKLDEHKAKGTLGLGFLKKYHAVLDLAALELRLSPLGSAPELRGDAVHTFEVKNDRICFPLKYADGKVGDVTLSTFRYDTFISSEMAGQLNKPAGDVSPVWLSPGNNSIDIDLSKYLAFRPKSFGSSENTDPRTPGAVFVTGVNFLESFRIEFDWENSKIAFSRVKDPQYPVSDFEYFKIENSNNADLMQAYLTKFPKSRLGAEGAEKLMTWRLAQGAAASNDQLMTALQWVIDTSLPERRMENCKEYIVRFRGMEGRSELAVKAANLALSYSRTAFTVQDIYRLHNIVGEEYWKAGNVKEAWKHFLSAAFMPLDNKTDRLHNVAVNVNLARVYDKQGSTVRAYSRYKQAEELLEPMMGLLTMPEDKKAALPPDGKAVLDTIVEVKSGLERLKKQISPENLKMLDS